MENLVIVYSTLLTVACKKQKTTYTEIAPILGFDMNLTNDRKKIGRVLGLISEAEHAQGRPLLTAVVVLKDKEKKTRPGPGCYELARKLKLLREDADAVAERDFFRSELQRVYEEWAP